MDVAHTLNTVMMLGENYNNIYLILLDRVTENITSTQPS